MVDQAELDALHRRITDKMSSIAEDRDRQRVLIRQMRTDGCTWDAIVEQAHVSRQTVRRALASSPHSTSTSTP